MKTTWLALVILLASAAPSGGDPDRDSGECSSTQSVELQDACDDGDCFDDEGADSEFDAAPSSCRKRCERTRKQCYERCDRAPTTTARARCRARCSHNYVGCIRMCGHHG